MIINKNDGRISMRSEIIQSQAKGRSMIITWTICLLKEEKIIPDLIICSTVIRSSARAEAVAKACGYKGEVTESVSMQLDKKHIKSFAAYPMTI